MPITGIFWDGNSGRDIHILRGGVTPDLTHRLKFHTDGSSDFADDYFVRFGFDVTLTFMPLFRGTPQGDDFVGDNGMTVNKMLGSVTVAANASLKTKNFIIEVTARNNSDGTIFEEKIRIQVHGAVSKVWLTPDQLTVPVSGPDGEIRGSRYRFAVRAQFDDGIVGDLTEGHGVTWSSQPAGHVAGDTGRLILAIDDPGDTFEITATLPPQLGGHATQQPAPKVRMRRRWSDDPSVPKISIVAGGALPSSGTVENTANVLLVSDGFRGEDEESFNRIVNTLVHHLKTNQLTKPFNLLSWRMNFWKVFIPADQIGISVRSEMSLVGIHPYARPIPAIRKPPPDPTPPKPPSQWKLPELLYAVGLPVPGDEAPARTPAILRSEWAQLLQKDPTNNVSDDLVKEWKQHAKRTLIEERDGFPGMSYGDAPAASQGDPTTLDLNPDRARIQHLRTVLATLGSDDLTLSGNQPVGVLWAEAPSDQNKFRFDNRDLVVFLSSFQGGRAANWPIETHGRYIAVSAGDKRYTLDEEKTDRYDYIPVKPVAGTNAYVLDMATAPTDIEADACRTVAHELGHSLGLGDEYVEFPPRRFTKQTADAADANLQTEFDTQIQDPNDPDPTKRIIHGDQIQWTWHRIVAAAVVNGAISRVDLDAFQIPLIPDVSFRFSKGDTVRLRPRTWGQPLRKFGPLDISGDLVITEPPASDSIVVRAVHLISAQAFPSGSLLYTPKPAPAAVLSVAYPYAEMVAKNIKEAITTNKKPLLEEPGPNNQPQYPLLVLGDPDVGITLDELSIARIVGLYAGGDKYFSGIFHPTGQCMMRNDHEQHAEFCAVCRYIMVDMIAPELHPDIDADYEKIYLGTLGTFHG